MDHLVYLRKPISSIKALSGVLQIPEDVLVDIATNRDAYFFENKPEKKSNGKERITYRLDDRLKFVQKKIKVNIFNHVKYPEYLLGSIKDKDNPRTYDRDANIHAGSHLIISEDVSDYFHTIDEKHILKMWKYLFGFPVVVAELLTRLTTYNGYVPQGGVTSSYLSNLVMWDLEPELVEKLERIGVTYTRYIDDITLSAQEKWLSKENLQESIKLVYVMLAAKGLKPNRKKHEIMSNANRMAVHKLNVNSGRPTLDKTKRKKTRLELFNLKKAANICGRHGKEYERQYNSVMGKVRELLKFHPTQGEKYLAELKQILPL